MDMKFKNCEICKKIKEEIPDIPDNLLDKYHLSLITIEDFPKKFQDKLIDIMLKFKRWKIYE
jgi:hypothetical protein